MLINRELSHLFGTGSKQEILVWEEAFMCSALLEGILKQKLQVLLDTCCLPTLDFTFACVFHKSWDMSLFGEIRNSKEANSQMSTLEYVQVCTLMG